MVSVAAYIDETPIILRPYSCLTWAKGKRVFIAIIADDNGYGWAIAKSLATAGAEILVGTWVPALNIFESSLRCGKFEASRMLHDGSLIEITKVYLLDVVFDILEDIPEDIRTNKRYEGCSKWTVEEVAESVKHDKGATSYVTLQPQMWGVVPISNAVALVLMCARVRVVFSQGNHWYQLFQGIHCPCSSKGAQCSQGYSYVQFSCPATIVVFPQFVPTFQLGFWPKFQSSNDLGFSVDMISFSPQFVRIIGDDAILYFLLLLYTSLCYIFHPEYVIEAVSYCPIQYRSADQSSCCLIVQHWISSLYTWLASMIVMPSLQQLAQYGLPATSPYVLSSSSQLVSNLALHWVCELELFFPGIVPPQLVTLMAAYQAMLVDNAAV